MGSIARPPCDEAAILGNSCSQPAVVNGPWILAATILGSSMAFIDGTVVNVAPYRLCNLRNLLTFDDILCGVF